MRRSAGRDRSVVRAGSARARHRRRAAPIRWTQATRGSLRDPGPGCAGRRSSALPSGTLFREKSQQRRCATIRGRRFRDARDDPVFTHVRSSKRHRSRMPPLQPRNGAPRLQLLPGLPQTSLNRYDAVLLLIPEKTRPARACRMQPAGRPCTGEVRLITAVTPPAGRVHDGRRDERRRLAAGRPGVLDDDGHGDLGVLGAARSRSTSLVADSGRRSRRCPSCPPPSRRRPTARPSSVPRAATPPSSTASSAAFGRTDRAPGRAPRARRAAPTEPPRSNDRVVSHGAIAVPSFAIAPATMARCSTGSTARCSGRSPAGRAPRLGVVLGQHLLPLRRRRSQTSGRSIGRRSPEPVAVDDLPAVRSGGPGRCRSRRRSC